MREVLQLTGGVLIFGFILYLAYIASKFVGKKAAKSTQSKHMQVIEQISLGLDKRLILVQVGSDYFLFLSGKKELQQVAKVEIKKEEQQEETNQTSSEPVFDFRQIFEKYVHNTEGKKQRANTRLEVDSKPQKSSGVRHNIHRLEQLREKTYDKEV